MTSMILLSLTAAALAALGAALREAPAPRRVRAADPRRSQADRRK